MTDRYQQACPYCQQAALFNYTDYKNRKYFYCDRCTEFEISRYAEGHIANASAELKLEFATQAKTAPEGFYFSLSRPEGDDPKGSTLIGKLLPKST